MAELDKNEFKFPDEVDNSQDEKVEIEIAEATSEKPNKSTKPPIDPEKFNMAEPTDEELDKYEESVRKRLKRFSKGYHDEKRRAEAAEQEREAAILFARQIAEENKKLKDNLGQNTNLLVGSVKAKAEGDLDIAKKRYKTAYENADSDELVAAQEALVAAKLQLDRVNNFRPPLQEKENTVQRELLSAQRPKADPKAMSWRQDNDWFGEDEEMTSLALGVHERLVKQGVDPTSDEYYDAINRTMRKRFPEKFEDSEEVETETKPRAKPSSVVSPATRSTAPKKIKLEPRQVQMAKKLGVPLELYAQHVAKQMRLQNG